MARIRELTIPASTRGQAATTGSGISTTDAATLTTTVAQAAADAVTARLAAAALAQQQANVRTPVANAPGATPDPAAVAAAQAALAAAQPPPEPVIAPLSGPRLWVKNRWPSIGIVLISGLLLALLTFGDPTGYLPTGLSSMLARHPNAFKVLFLVLLAVFTYRLFDHFTSPFNKVAYLVRAAIIGWIAFVLHPILRGELRELSVAWHGILPAPAAGSLEAILLPVVDFLLIWYPPLWPLVITIFVLTFADRAVGRLRPWFRFGGGGAFINIVLLVLVFGSLIALLDMLPGFGYLPLPVVTMQTLIITAFIAAVGMVRGQLSQNSWGSRQLFWLSVITIGFALVLYLDLGNPTKWDTSINHWANIATTLLFWIVALVLISIFVSFFFESAFSKGTFYFCVAVVVVLFLFSGGGVMAWLSGKPRVKECEYTLLAGNTTPLNLNAGLKSGWLCFGNDATVTWTGPNLKVGSLRIDLRDNRGNESQTPGITTANGAVGKDHIALGFRLSDDALAPITIMVIVKTKP